MKHKHARMTFPIRSYIWPCYGFPTRSDLHTENPWVEFDADGDVRIGGLLSGIRACVTRRTARILARRLNQALDMYRRCGGK